MITRMHPVFDDGRIPAPTSYTDYYEIEALGDTYVVPLSTALAIDRQLDQRATSDGLEFHDVFGARHRLPGRCVYRISESTRETRAAVRAFARPRPDVHDSNEDPFNDR